MAFREGNSALYWAATRPEDITPAGAVAVGHFVQVGLATPMCRVAASCRITRKPPRWTQREDTVREMALAFQTDPLPGVEKSLDTARTSACRHICRSANVKLFLRRSLGGSSAACPAKIKKRGLFENVCFRRGLGASADPLPRVGRVKAKWVGPTRTSGQKPTCGE